MCPVVVKEVKGKSKRAAWLPTWASVDVQSGTFRFDAEWQGPIPGMDKTLRETYILAASVQLANCNLAGLDSSTPVGGLGACAFVLRCAPCVCALHHYPTAAHSAPPPRVTGHTATLCFAQWSIERPAGRLACHYAGASSGRMFLFEVQAMPQTGFTEPTVYLFQALSPEDMSAWSDAFLAATAAATRGGVAMRSPQISGPTANRPTAPPSVNKMVNVLDSDDDDDSDGEDKL